MYDTFILKIPVQCTNCYTGAYYEFQTKQFDCALDVYEQGKPAVAYYRRSETPEEYEDKVREWRETEPDFVENELCHVFGSIRKTDKVIPGSQIPDGEYTVYTGCDECDKLFFVKAVIKDGIFIGVK